MLWKSYPALQPSWIINCINFCFPIPWQIHIKSGSENTNDDKFKEIVYSDICLTSSSLGPRL